ncbi:putative ABC transporter ATP-binding protein [Gordonia hirsuta DSM 44140 = NBRC 16056]|uniref:Putative ABC transporter ATP-binding protein n=1 Tax=Gordonia hirsuta DSM 44140 = NBRC 16056 TaxID=1121927 RepID=L7L6T3_9ACTN|nr:ATP-binding cassette domain-containing protein [Gordonia hirsuta]GAC56451.1 putative ABC transporter ATP-binding protein [Gordonia hirsuta DSM 44140 = NBRC 16056]
MPHPDGRPAGGGTTPLAGTTGSGGLDPLLDTMPWVPDDDPTLAQLRSWRRELNGDTAVEEPNGDRRPHTGTAISMPTPATTPAPDVTTGTRSVSVPAPERAPARRGRHGRHDDGELRTGTWAIPGLGWHRDAAPSDEAVAAPAAPRRLPEGKPTWDVTRPAPPQPITSPEELARAQLSTEAFPALDLVPIGENADLEMAIEATGLRKVFGDFVAVDGVSLQVPKGRIVAILGPNGAGKTTTVNMLCTLLKPDGGTATVNGFDVVKDAPGVRRSVMLTGQFAALDEGLTGRENLVMFGRLLGLKKKAAKQRADELLATFGLGAAAGRKVGQYSGGMRRRIDIACGLVTEPQVVFLDEPTTGLDPRSRQDVWGLVENLRDQGVTILLTTQYLEEADSLADRIVVIDKGKVIAEGTSDELKAATGAAYCEITPVHPAYLPRLRATLHDLLGPTAADVDPGASALSVPAPNGPTTLAEILKRTEAAQIPLADIALRRPSLDEVFLALTDPERERPPIESDKAPS